MEMGAGRAAAAARVKEKVAVVRAAAFQCRQLPPSRHGTRTCRCCCWSHRACMCRGRCMRHQLPPRGTRQTRSVGSPASPARTRSAHRRTRRGHNSRTGSVSRRTRRPSTHGHRCTRRLSCNCRCRSIPSDMRGPNNWYLPTHDRNYTRRRGRCRGRCSAQGTYQYRTQHHSTPACKHTGRSRRDRGQGAPRNPAMRPQESAQGRCRYHKPAAASRCRICKFQCGKLRALCKACAHKRQPSNPPKPSPAHSDTSR